MLRPQDLAVATVLALPDMRAWTYAPNAVRLGLSTSEAHAAVKRAAMAGLVRGRAVDRPALLEFLKHGARYAFYATRGAPTRGVPTGVLAPPLNALLSAKEGPVWPSSDGTTRGYALAPLYRTAMADAKENLVRVARALRRIGLVDSHAWICRTAGAHGRRRSCRRVSSCPCEREFAGVLRQAWPIEAAPSGN